MTRFAFASAAACLACALTAPAAFAQSKAAAAPVTKAAPTTPAPAAPAKFVRPIKGLANVEVIPGNPKKVGLDLITVMKVKNTSAGAISLLKIDEYWYDKKLQVVTGDSEAYRKPFQPGEVIEITLKSPIKPGMDLYKSQYKFSHAGGEVKPKTVKKFE
jgi:hypothetical protein